MLDPVPQKHFTVITLYFANEITTFEPRSKRVPKGLKEIYPIVQYTSQLGNTKIIFLNVTIFSSYIFPSCPVRAAVNTVSALFHIHRAPEYRGLAGLLKALDTSFGKLSFNSEGFNFSSLYHADGEMCLVWSDRAPLDRPVGAFLPNHTRLLANKVFRSFKQRRLSEH